MFFLFHCTHCLDLNYRTLLYTVHITPPLNITSYHCKERYLKHKVNSFKKNV